MRIYFTTELNIKEKDEVWKLLCNCNKEFIPYLSKRKSPTDNSFNFNDNDDKPTKYFNGITKQYFVLAKKNNQIIAFLTFIHNYKLEFIKINYLSNYVTTICISQNNRGIGISKLIYDYFEYSLPKEIKYQL